MPGNAVDVPGNAVGVPGNAVGVPGNAVGMPGNADGVPGNAVDLPGIAVDAPSNAVGIHSNVVTLRAGAADDLIKSSFHPLTDPRVNGSFAAFFRNPVRKLPKDMHVSQRRFSKIRLLGVVLVFALQGFAGIWAQGVNEAWVRRYNGPNNAGDRAEGIVVDAAGNVVVTGGSGSDIYTGKYTAAGALLWEKLFNGPNYGVDGVVGLALDAQGNVVITGWSATSGTNYDIYTAKYAAANGALLWEKYYNGTGNGNDFSYRVAVDGNGDVVIVGTSVGNGVMEECYTAKLSGITGNIIWQKRFSAGAADGHFLTGVVIDSANNVIVSGSCKAPSKAREAYTAKYAGATGDLLWERRLAGPAIYFGNSIHAVTLDALGNVIVTGSKYPDIYTAKYAAANGAVLWERTFNGPDNRPDEGSDVTVDGEGNVLIVGISESASGPYDMYTAKCAGSDGSLLWDRRYNGPGNKSDWGGSVRVTPTGGVVVSGTSYGSGSEGDIYVARYHPMTGAVEWEARYNGPANKHDYFEGNRGLAVAADGSVLIAAASPGVGTGGDIATVKYVPVISVPAVATAVAANISSSAATLNGSVNSNGGVTTAQFQYGLTTSYSGAVPVSLFPSDGSTPVGVSIRLNGLQPETTYHYRLTATNSAGTTNTLDGTFTTKVDPDTDNDGLPDAWEVQHWGAKEYSNATSDSDDDGLPELIEYAFNRSPVASDSTSVVPAVVENGFLTVTIAKSEGVAYLVETAGDLNPASWNAANTTVLINDATTLKVRDNVAVTSGASARYLRVRVTAQE